MNQFKFSQIHLIVILVAAAVLLLAPVGSATAAGTLNPLVSVMDAWKTIEAPPPPELKSVRVDPQTSALLILDIESRTTNMEQRPRAVASVPRIWKLLQTARAKGVAVVYSLTSKGTPESILPEVAPRQGEAVVKSSVDKFFQTDLEDILKKKEIKTVIVVGTAAEGAVLHTATAAAMRQFDVIVPVDGMSSSELYAEQYVCWHLVNAPGSRKRTTLTRIGMIEFGN